MLDFLSNWFLEKGFEFSTADILARAIILASIFVLAIIVFRIAKRLIIKALSVIIGKTQTQWDDVILRKKVFNRLAYLAPAIVLYMLVPIPFRDYDSTIDLFNGAITIYIIAIVVLALDAFLNAVLTIYTTYEVSDRIPIKGFIQVIKIIIYFTSGIFVISILIDKTPIYLFSSLGAITAVLMFIFKDAILGFVAGIQLSANQMVANGDWIEMPKYGANGSIIEIALTTVKVQNWDKTITTIPTYALITESFKNWRGMAESGGRRIKRSINLDMNTVKFCTNEMLTRFAKIQYISEYINKKNKELTDENKKMHVDDTSLVNGRRMTNIGTFRAYVEAYLKNHPDISQEMTFLVRQLEPSEHGVPLEIYVFSKVQDWGAYENIQSNIFDHILAVVPEFDLSVFQNPSGMDFRSLSK